MQTIENKTIQNIALGDFWSVQRTMQAGDVRVWAAASRKWRCSPVPARAEGAAGIVTVILTVLVGLTLPGP